MNVEDTIKYILNSFHEKNNSHAFLLSTNNINKCLDDVLNIVKKIKLIFQILNNLIPYLRTNIISFAS